MLIELLRTIRQACIRFYKITVLTSFFPAGMPGFVVDFLSKAILQHFQLHLASRATPLDSIEMTVDGD